MRSKCLLICFALAIAAIAGCARSARPFLQSGSILILPPRDVIQDGKPHEKGADSGATLLQDLSNGFEADGWATLLTDNRNFSYLTIATEHDALAEAKRLNAHYVLQVVLGEFLDAAPMTFRSDFVTLQQARLWNAESGQLVWSIDTPIVYSGTNLGHYYRFLDKISDFIVHSISQ